MNIRKIARRSFLIGSSAVAGGVAFGAYSIARPSANPLLADQQTGEAVFNPYIKLDASGITLITPRADMGQGAYHVQTLLMAEELDVDPANVKFEPGQPSPAYWNEGMAVEAAESMSGQSEGMSHDITYSAVRSMMKVFGMQVTGGSTTVPDGYVKLREAAACARETIKEAAAKRTGNKISDLRTEDGAVILPDGSIIPYGELAEEAANIRVPKTVTLRDPSQWRLLGKPSRRVDVVAKSTGTARFGIDEHVEGMVHAAVRMNPAQSSGMTGFDPSDAKSMRGVHDVVGVTGGYAVIADNTWRAFQALDAVIPEWEPSDMPATMEDHWQAISDAFTDDHKEMEARNDGEIDKALGEDDVIEGEYRTPYLAHAPLEPMNAIVLVTDDRAEVWTGTQVPRFVQANVARITGLDPDHVRVNVSYLGGSFGHRLEDEIVKQCTEIAMQMKGTPVKLTYSREEDMQHDFTRQISMARMRGSIKDGHVNGLDLHVAMPSVIASQMGRQGMSIPGPDAVIVTGAGDQPFAIPNQRVTGYRVPPLAPLSSWRSVGASSNGFMFNSALEELIEAAGADPLEERIHLADNDITRNVLQTLKEIAGWTGSDLGKNRGRGVALTKSFGVNCAQVIEVTNGDDGISIDKVYCVADVGRVLDPDHFENLVQGGVIWGLAHAMNCEITYTDGIADQLNFYDYEGMRINQCPDIIVHALETDPQIRGIGEPPVPPAAPALANAIYAATGQRLREMPFSKFVDFA